MSSQPVVSPAGIIHVLGFSPNHGLHGAQINVRIHFHPDLADAMFVRLVVGNKAVPTRVTQLANVTYGRWQLQAVAPPLDHALFPDSRVLMAVQALSNDSRILDSVAFGEFTYGSQHDRNNSRPPRLQIPSGELPLRRRSHSHLPSPCSAGFSRSPGGSTRLHRRVKTQSIVRSKHGAGSQENDDLYPQTPILDLVTPLSSLCLSWSPDEVAAGRRLVRFSKVQDGRKLIVSCEPVLQEAYCESDTVISCIYRQEVEACFVTSVDVIYLLERLTNGEFPVEEKNRIRRNLEGLRPTTVSKHKPGFGDFFQRIMDFPDPKPRNIEKDLKVFEWNLLGQALEKILSKYASSIYARNDSPDSSPSDIPALAADDIPDSLTLSYPTDPQELAKYETLPDDAPLISPVSYDSPSGDQFISPVEGSNTSSSSSSSPIFPVFAPDSTVSNPTPQSTIWAPGHGDMKASDSLDSFGGGVGVMDPLSNPMDPAAPDMHSLMDPSGLGYPTLYESLVGLADDSLTLADYV